MATKNLINAFPTKDLFISMLIRDLTLRDAIGDLVDNSVDGARASTISKKNRYSGLWVKITANASQFIIEDNCGGFSVKIARDYAFRFGRPAGTPNLKGSIGQFGIGMKRALFKLGHNFKISSISKHSHFDMTVDVSKWRDNSDDWNFEFGKCEENQKITNTSLGTKIEVTNLRDEVIQQFKEPSFIKKLVSEIELENLYSIHQGLEISINGHKLKPDHLKLLKSKEIKSSYLLEKFDDGISVEIFAGVSEPVLEDGGWYIFCNDRLVVGPEQSEITGWTGGRSDMGGPKYHGQYMRFRGYVFFEADDASLLPWNTTKNNMDMDSPKYKAIRQTMILMMKPIISFLNKMKEERENDSSAEDRPLEKIMKKATPTMISALDEIDLNKTFTYPLFAQKKKKGADEQRITYLKSKEQIDAVKKHLGVSTLTEVGEKTFEYFIEMEID